MKKQGLKDLILDGMRYLAIALFWLGFMIAGLWCVSCGTPRDSVVVYPHAEDFDFDIDRLIYYDPDRNTGLYVVEDTVVVNCCGFIIYDTLELHFTGTMIEDLQQGEPAWVSEGKWVLYD